MLSVGKVVFFCRFVALFGKKYGSFSPKFLLRIFFGSKFEEKVSITSELEGEGG